MASLPPAADDTRTTFATGARRPVGGPGVPPGAGSVRGLAEGVWRAGLWLLVVAVVSLPAGAAEPTGYRRLAPGVLTVIPADRSGDDALLRADIPEITTGLGEFAWEPKQSPVGATLVEQGRNRDFPRDIWALEFAFKPPRQIDVDVPARDFRMQRKRVWYLVYRVKNTGARRIVMADGDATRLRSETVQQPVRFLPHFVLESVEGLSKQEGALAFRAYLDRVVPGAVAAIREREDTRIDLHDSARMTERDLAPGEERWGVAVWEDVDPRIDYFSIYIRGLTNAIRWRPRADATFAADSVPVAGEEHVLESLRLDFWRPGDDATSLDDEMSVGHAGMYERRTIGSRVLEALGRGRMTASAPREGLERLGLSWEEILDPPAAVKAAGAVDREAPPSLVPLTKVVNALARLQPPAARPAAIRTLFGGVGQEWFEDLVRGLSAPLDEERAALRRGMLDRCGVSEDDVSGRPLESLVKVLSALEATAPAATRRSATVALFGAAAPRLDSLVHELDLARARAVLDDLDFDRRPVLAGGALTAYDTILTVVGAESDEAKRARIVTGLLGAEGPALLAAATAVREGVDHAWVFRYER